MVDATKACESAWVSADLVKDSKTKRLVIENSGEYVAGKYGEMLELLVTIDGKQKKWSPNRDSATNIKNALGADTTRWIGAVINLQLIVKNGKQVILGIPSAELPQKEEEVHHTEEIKEVPL